MNSGSPAFGTPSHFQASPAAGQLARFIDLPWRSAAGSAAALNDVRAANENQFVLRGGLMAGATVVIHSTGWIEGGLSVSYEKLFRDVEVLNMVAELCAGSEAGEDWIGYDTAQSRVDPGGHVFSAPQTIERHQSEFNQPIVHDYANFGTWEERGAVDAGRRATGVWKGILEAPPEPMGDPDRTVGMREFIARRTEEGGVPPES